MKPLILAFALIGQVALASTASAEADVCFTPGEDCAGFIVRQIDAAKSEMLVMAYGFTNATILNAIARANERGVRVTLLLDKSNASNGKPEGRCIEALIDGRSGKAHNKVIVIDKRHVITGSFNFTEAAQKKNAENVLLIANEPALVQRFTANFAQLVSKARQSNFKPCP
jgi:phosphatidylserine/phosphatidylglycerophosphate/cardiolipin synthase-like enzyme